VKLSQIRGTSAAPQDSEAEKRRRALTQSLANIEADKEGYRATSGMGAVDRLRAGIGSGLVGTWDRVGNLVLPKALEKGSRYSEEAIQARKQQEADLASTGAGAAGKLIGEIAATAPIGLAARGAVAGGKGLLDASRGIQAASGAANIGRGGRVAAAALEGAASGAATSDVGQGGQAALMGGALGGAFSGVGEGIGAMRGKATDEARQLMQETGEFIPASHALPEESLLKQINEGVIANLPGSNIRKQHGKAVEAVRQEVIEKAIPEGLPTNAVFARGEDTPMRQVADDLKKAWDTAFDDVNKSRVKGFKVPQEVADQIDKLSEGTVRIPQPGQVMSGAEMLKFQEAVNSLANEIPSGPLGRTKKAQLQSFAKMVDSRIGGQLSGQLNQFGEDIGETFLKNKDKYFQWKTLEKTMKGAPNAEFSPRQFERIVTKRGDKVYKDTAEKASKVLRPFPSNRGVFQTQAALGLAGLGGGGLLGWNSSGEDATFADKATNALLGAGGAYMGSKMASSELAQKALVDYGTKGQRALTRALREAGAVGRRGTIAALNEDEETR
jgi:hypothetical protein